VEETVIVPVAVDPVVEEPVVTNPVVEEPVAVDPVVEEPVAADPVVEEPAAVDPYANYATYDLEGANDNETVTDDQDYDYDYDLDYDYDQDYDYGYSIPDIEDYAETTEVAENDINSGSSPLATTATGIRQQLVDYAASRVGNTPYVWAGRSLETGTDCSGFVNLIYDKFGMYASSGSDDYQNVEGDWGTNISYSELQPGDVVVYRQGGHVGIYAGQDENGNDIVIHDSNPEEGVKISDMNYTTPTAYVRIINDGANVSYDDDDSYDDESYNNSYSDDDYYTDDVYYGYDDSSYDDDDEDDGDNGYGDNDDYDDYNYGNGWYDEYMY
jgi:cell wall-associated NlpC family hydrolase